MFAIFRRALRDQNKTSKCISRPSMKPILEELEDRSLLSGPPGLVTYTGKASFLAATGATSATGMLPELGTIPGGRDARQTVGSVTFSISAPSHWMDIGAASFPEQDFTLRLPGPDLGISGSENLNVDLASPVVALGFDFVEPRFDPHVNAPFVDSTFGVTLKSGGAIVGSFFFNAPNDTAAFVGVWSALSFDRVEIREVVGDIENEFWGQFYTTPALRSDIAPTSLTWNAAQGGVDFGYEVTGADLTQDTTAALYWASGTTFADVIGAPVYDTPIEREVGEYGPFYIPNSVLGKPPPGATHLLLVTDPPTATMPNGLIDESDETNNVRALAIPDIVLISATTNDSRSVTITYEVRGADLDTVPIRIYRSTDGNVDLDTDTVLALLNPSAVIPGMVGPHTVTLALAEPLRIIPSSPHILVQADPDGTVIETDEVNGPEGFRKRVLGVVTHGFNPFGFTSFGFTGWITDLAANLRNSQMYDRTVAFDWNSTSFLPIPGMTEQAGWNMALRVQSELAQMDARWPDDIVDVHFIGHSRGSVVISQALQNLVDHPEIARGYTKMTMLDPHPAHNHPLDPQYSVIPAWVPGLGRLGRIAEGVLLAFQALADDPEVHVPRNVDGTEVFYQHKPWYAAPFPETILNLWGEVPVLNLSGLPVHYCDLTNVGGMSHTGVVDWYQKNVVPSLKDGLPHPCPSSATMASGMATQDSAPQAAIFDADGPAPGSKRTGAFSPSNPPVALAGSRDAVFAILATDRPSPLPLAASRRLTTDRATAFTQPPGQDAEAPAPAGATPTDRFGFGGSAKLLGEESGQPASVRLAYLDLAFGDPEWLRAMR